MTITVSLVDWLMYSVSPSFPCSLLVIRHGSLCMQINSTGGQGATSLHGSECSWWVGATLPTLLYVSLEMASIAYVFEDLVELLR